MRNNMLLLMFVTILLTSCSQKIDKADLIGGNWIAAAGYEEGELGGEPNCHPFEEGLEFKDDNTAYNAAYEEDFDYVIFEEGKDNEIVFELSGPGTYRFHLHMISENEIGFEGIGLNKGRSCYLERK